MSLLHASAPKGKRPDHWVFKMNGPISIPSRDAIPRVVQYLKTIEIVLIDLHEAKYRKTPFAVISRPS